jgi:hypothetical protein
MTLSTEMLACAKRVNPRARAVTLEQKLAEREALIMARIEKSNGVVSVPAAASVSSAQDWYNGKRNNGD